MAHQVNVASHHKQLVSNEGYFYLLYQGFRIHRSLFLRPVKTISRSKDELKGYVLLYIYIFTYTHIYVYIYINIYIYITHLFEKRCNLVTAKNNILRSLVGYLP